MHDINSVYYYYNLQLFIVHLIYIIKLIINTILLYIYIYNSFTCICSKTLILHLYVLTTVNKNFNKHLFNNLH